MTRTVSAGPVVAVILLLAGTCRAEDPSARARLDSTTYLLGDRIAVHVELIHPAGVTFQNIPGDTLGGFTVLSRLPFTPVTPGRTTTGVILSRYEPGTIEIPPLPFLASVPGDSAVHLVRTAPLLVELVAVEVDTTSVIRDLKPILGMPYTLAEILLALGISALAAGAAYGAWLLWRRRRTRAPEGVAAGPPRPAHVLALEALAILKEKRLWQQGRLKEYYSELTEIHRRYLELRFGLMALEETTDEILVGMRRVAIGRPLVEETEQLLRRADLVKFAKFSPEMEEHDRSFSAVRSFVERTRTSTVPVEGGAPHGA